MGGAFLLAGGRKGIVKLVIKFLSNRSDSVQDGCDAVSVWWIEQHGLQFVAHLPGCRGEGTEYGGDEGFSFTFFAAAVGAVAYAFCGGLYVCQQPLNLRDYARDSTVRFLQLLIKRFGKCLATLLHSLDAFCDVFCTAAFCLNHSTGFSCFAAKCILNFTCHFLDRVLSTPSKNLVVNPITDQTVMRQNSLLNPALHYILELTPAERIEIISHLTLNTIQA
ncbi:DNA-directed RNA polymerase subunit beta, putative [Babesia ovata]|uniref:DNA-directed RNA polymerase subunit beta, putative n=1 Tax=Babesia ovata TaxID=189622 RepID=A0A2H6KJW7_9APIC|nr:DNA-directed RNA polymerase subunit beta, putative [Babesia ovata]GBE63278.1 DNA-directed RNA polymerase subunit beta, putative [Babesia ovata]